MFKKLALIAAFALTGCYRPSDVIGPDRLTGEQRHIRSEVLDDLKDNATIICVNHTLYVADMVADGPMLTPYHEAGDVEPKYCGQNDVTLTVPE